MKKFILLALIMSFAFSNIHAQLKMPTSGYVGIGSTTNEYYPLDVVSSSGFFDPSLAYHATEGFGFEANASNGEELVGGVATTSPYAAWLQVRNWASYSDPLSLNPLGGNVGIGTISPISTFDVYGNLSVGTTTNAGYVGKVQITTGGTSPICNRLTFGTDNSGWKFAISKNYYNNGNNIVTDLMTIQDDGNVGIGTTTPNNLLQVAHLINFNNSSYNTYLGYYTGGASSSFSTAIGWEALYFSNGGSYNTAVGMFSLDINTTGSDNTALGYNAGGINGNTTCSNSTFIGYSADANGNFSNATAVGNGAITTASNHIMIGNSSVTAIGGYQAWTNYSDGRFKFNIQQNVKGLVFINKLRPVTYQLNTKQLDNFIVQNMSDSAKTQHQAGMDFSPSTAIVHSGFIAQEVDAAANAVGFTSSIVHRPENSTDPYALSYAEIVVPLVKAVQELSKTNDSLKSVQKTTDSLLTALQKQYNTAINNLQQQINNCCTTGSLTKTDGQTGINDNSNSIANPILYQNNPNPFSQQTQIKCFIPANAMMAYIYIYDMQGTQLRKIQVNGKGDEAITIQGSEFRSGMYMYTLIIDGKEIDTKKMILTD